LLILKNSMHTKTAKEIAKKRTDFIESFLNQLRKEILQRESENIEDLAVEKFNKAKEDIIYSDL